ncbi:MAG: hypothetical protein AAB552_00395 [Patescibacteria group bacterium]
MTAHLSLLATQTGIPFALLEGALHPLPEVVSQATTCNEAQLEYYSSRPGNPARHAALKRWIALCFTIDEIRQAAGQTLLGSQDESDALIKWASLYTTIPQALEVRSRTRLGSEEERVVLLKMIEIHNGR